MKKKLFSIVLAALMTGTMAMSVFAEEAAPVAPAEKVVLTTADQVVTMEVPSDEWKQIEAVKANEAISDGDCNITISFFAKDAELPARAVANKDYAAAYEVTASDDKMIVIVSGLGKEADDMAIVKAIIDSISIDFEKVTDEMLGKKEIKADEYSVKDENYTAWISAKEGLNLRAGGTGDDSVLALMPFRSQVTVTGTVLHNGEDNGWRRVVYNGVTGYASCAYISTSEPETEPETQPETQPEYIGYQYANSDPWGGTLSVTLRSVANGEIEWTYTDVLPDGNMIYKEKSTPYTNGYTEWYIEGMINDDMTYNYAGNFKLQGGYVEFTFESGEVMEGDPEIGQSAAYQVGPLLASGENTVALYKQANN